jgi:hypothetical protein
MAFRLSRLRLFRTDYERRLIVTREPQCVGTVSNLSAPHLPPSPKVLQARQRGEELRKLPHSIRHRSLLTARGIGATTLPSVLSELVTPALKALRAKSDSLL